MLDNELISTEQIPATDPVTTEPPVVATESVIDADEKYRRLQSYSSKKEDSLIKSLVAVSKKNPDVLLDLAGETETDIAFRNRVVKDATDGAFETFEEYEASLDISPTIADIITPPVTPPTPPMDTIENSLSILAITDKRFESEEGKAEFRKHYNILNPALPETERIKIVMDRFLPQPAASSEPITIRPSSTQTMPLPPKEPTKAEKDAAEMARKLAVKAKYKS